MLGGVDSGRVSLGGKELVFMHTSRVVPDKVFIGGGDIAEMITS